MVESEVVATYRGEVVGLRRVGLGVVFGKRDAFSFQVGKMGLFDDLGEVLSGVVRSAERSSTCMRDGKDAHLVLEPNGDESVKGLAA